MIEQSPLVLAILWSVDKSVGKIAVDGEGEEINVLVDCSRRPLVVALAARNAPRSGNGVVQSRATGRDRADVGIVVVVVLSRYLICLERLVFFWFCSNKG